LGTWRRPRLVLRSTFRLERAPPGAFECLTNKSSGWLIVGRRCACGSPSDRRSWASLTGPTGKSHFSCASPDPARRVAHRSAARRLPQAPNWVGAGQPQAPAAPLRAPETLRAPPRAPANSFLRSGGTGYGHGSVLTPTSLSNLECSGKAKATEAGRTKPMSQH